MRNWQSLCLLTSMRFNELGWKLCFFTTLLLGATSLGSLTSVIKSFEQVREQDQKRLQQLGQELRDQNLQLEDLKLQLSRQQGALAIEAMLEVSQSNEAKLSFDEQLRAINEQMPSSELALRQQEQKVYVNTAAPAESDVMISLTDELTRLRLKVNELKSQYLEWVNDQKIFADTMRNRQSDFMQNWWTLENYLESTYNSTQDLLDEARLEYDAVAEKIAKENRQINRLVASQKNLTKKKNHLP